MTVARAFIGMGSNAPDARDRLEAALAALDSAHDRVAACARPRWTPFEGAKAPDVLNTVVELRATGRPRDLLGRLRAIEHGQGRDRGDVQRRTLDLDLLAFGDERVDEPGLTVPHPRALHRAFVLAPWAEIAPNARVADHEVIRWRAGLEAASPHAFEGHRIEEALSFAARPAAATVLRDRAALQQWRASCDGSLGVVPTMGALHAGHASLVQRAGAENEYVVVTLFVNPLQFAPGEDLDRYPRTFDEDCALLARHGVHAVYAPAPEDLYAADHSTFVVPRALADAYEGATRPTHFEGVTTVVSKLLNRVRADRAYFARKDAQQLAIVQRMHRDLDLPGRIRTCATVYESSGLALSSRNRFLDTGQTASAIGLSRALRAMRSGAAGGTVAVDRLQAVAREVFQSHGLDNDYVDVVDAQSFQPLDELGPAPALAIAAVRVGETRLLDNRWIALPVESVSAGGDGPGSGP